MDNFENESLDTQLNQDVENATENQEQEATVTISKADYDKLVGERKYLRGQNEKYNKLKDEFNELKSNSANAEDKPQQNVESNGELINSIRIDNPALSRDEAAEVATKVKNVAKIEGVSEYDALKGDYISNVIEKFLSNKRNSQATAHSTHVSAGASAGKIDTKRLFNEN